MKILKLKIKNKTFYTVLLGMLTKRGNSSKAKKLLNDTFHLASSVLKVPVDSLFLKIILNLNCFVEVKRLRSKRSNHLVPFTVTYKRKLYLISRWLLDSASTDTRRVCLSEKLSKEIIDLVSGKNVKSFSYRKQNFNAAVDNKSNIHYRW